MGKTFLDWSDLNVQPHFWSRLYEAIGSPGDFVDQSVEGQTQGDSCDVSNENANEELNNNIDCNDYTAQNDRINETNIGDVGGVKWINSCK